MSFFKSPTVTFQALQQEVSQEISANLEESFEATENILRGQPLVSLVDGMAAVADSSEPTHYGKFIGLAASDAPTGQQVSVRNSGEFELLSWNFASVGPVFYNENGEVTQVCPTAPGSHHCQIIGTAITNSKIVVDDEPAVLA
jgi:hypothetical protein